MTDPDQHEPEPDQPRPRDIDPFRWPFSRRKDRPQRPSRRQRIADEIAANRRGEYTVPTWVLGLGLALMLVVICGFLLFY
jgi:hypothetical protein